MAFVRRPKKKRDFGAKRRRKICRFCEDNVRYISHLDERVLRRFVSDRGKIVPRRISGNCAIHQRTLTQAVKRARFIAIMPFVNESYR